MTKLTQAEHDVLAERTRQINVEGFTAAHDDKHRSGEIVCAAVSYCFVVINPNAAPHWWPWSTESFKPKGKFRELLVKAAALIIAEIERLDREKKKD